MADDDDPEPSFLCQSLASKIEMSITLLGQGHGSHSYPELEVHLFEEYEYSTCNVECLCRALNWAGSHPLYKAADMSSYHVILYVHATQSLPMNHPTDDLRHCFQNFKAIVCEDTESQASGEESFLHSCARQPSLPTPSCDVCTRHFARFDRTPHRMLLHSPGAGVRNDLDLRHKSSSTSCDGAVRWWP